LSPIAETALASWSLEPGLLALLLVTAFVYARGFRRLHRAQPFRFARWRLGAFFGGLTTLWVALASPLDAFAGLLLQVHMLQHLLLMMVAPPLLLLGAPLAPLLRGLPRVLRKDVLGPFLASPGLQGFARRLTHPITGWLALAAVTWLWHLPAAYELALRDPTWHELEHACFLGAALLFWWPVTLPWPARSPWPRVAMIPYLVLADLQNTAFSALFAFSDRVFYASYAAAPRLIAGTALSDQAAAGAIMWVPASIAFLAPVAFILRELLEPAALRRAGPPRRAGVGGPTLRNGRFDLLRTPALGRVLRSLAFRRAAQGVCLLLAAAVVLDGFLGPSMSPMNLAGVLPWTYWRGLVIVGLLAAGNLFCFSCPFMLTRDLGRRVLPARLRWPRPLRSKWLAVGLVALYLGVYEVFDLWDDTRATAVIVLGYFVLAGVVDGLFRGASFCKYICPIGQFQFLGSTLSPLEVKVRAPEVCKACTTHECIRGSASRRGCELELFLPTKVGNLDCTGCLDCVRACPHDNIGLLPAVPGRELTLDASRSSIGRLSRRPDLAALALVLVAGAFANAAGMVAPVSAATLVVARSLGSLALAETLLLVVGGLLIPILLVTLASVTARTLGRSGRPLREIATRFTLTLVPLGFGMWAAHLLFHLGLGAGTLLPVLQRLASDAGLAWLGAPDWRMSHAGTASGALLGLEILLLDLGLLLTLYGSRRIARRLAAGPRRALAMQAPFALLATATWLVGLWILVQPMEMRGMMMHG
jgi:cytochrome c oxidase assembly factor CtaG/ferredoxin